MPAIKPPRLRKGDVIGLVAPASPIRPPDKIEKACRYLEGQGYRVLLGEHVRRDVGFLAGTDEERLADLNRMIRDRRVKAIFALRGGYGCGRLLSQVDYEALRRKPKIISGFSDITALQLAIYRKCNLVTFSGPMPAVEFWQKPDQWTEENFWRLLTSGAPVGELKNPEDAPIGRIAAGKKRGILLGGNLALIVSLLGTPFCPSFRNAILVIEDVEETPYRLDRMLTQLRNAGIAEKLAGLAFGKFTKCEPKDPHVRHPTAAQVLEDFARAINRPALCELQYGHVPKKLTLPLGLRAKMDVEAGRIEVLEPAVV